MGQESLKWYSCVESTLCYLEHTWSQLKSYWFISLFSQGPAGWLLAPGSVSWAPSPADSFKSLTETLTRRYEQTASCLTANLTWSVNFTSWTHSHLNDYHKSSVLWQMFVFGGSCTTCTIQLAASSCTLHNSFVTREIVDSTNIWKQTMKLC